MATAVLPPFSVMVTVSAGSASPAASGLTSSAKSNVFHDASVDTMLVATLGSSLAIGTDVEVTVQSSPPAGGGVLSSFFTFVSLSGRPALVSVIVPPVLLLTSIFSASATVKVTMLLSRQSAGALSNVHLIDPFACQMLSSPGLRTMVPLPRLLPISSSATVLFPFLAATFTASSPTSNSACFAFWSVTMSLNSSFSSCSNAILALASSAAYGVGDTTLN